jgi:hypothetical protein
MWLFGLVVRGPADLAGQVAEGHRDGLVAVPRGVLVDERGPQRVRHLLIWRPGGSRSHRHRRRHRPDGHHRQQQLQLRHPGIPGHPPDRPGRWRRRPRRVRPRADETQPYLVRAAVSILDAHPAECTFVGDSTTDMLAGRLAGVPVIGYANKPGKAELLTRAGADTVTTSMDEITTALRLAPPAPAVLD